MNLVHMQAVGFIRHKFSKVYIYFYLFLHICNLIFTSIYFYLFFEWFWHLMSHFRLQVMFEVQCT